MIVYHGTGAYCMDELLKFGPCPSPQAHLGGRKAFSTTLDFEIASLFAIRRSPPSILQGDEREAGVVLEYEVDPGSKEGKDWKPVVCPGVLQDEKEVAVFDAGILIPVAVWRLEGGDWKRNPLLTASVR